MSHPTAPRPGPWHMRRDDWLLTRPFVIGLVVLAAIPVALRLHDWATGRPLLWSARATVDPPTVAEPLQRGASGVWDSLARWALPGASLGRWLMPFVPVLLALAVIGVVSWLAWRILAADVEGLV